MTNKYLKKIKDILKITGKGAVAGVAATTSVSTSSFTVGNQVVVSVMSDPSLNGNYNVKKAFEAGLELNNKKQADVQKGWTQSALEFQAQQQLAQIQGESSVPAGLVGSAGLGGWDQTNQAQLTGQGQSSFSDWSQLILTNAFNKAHSQSPTKVESVDKAVTFKEKDVSVYTHPSGRFFHENE